MVSMKNTVSALCAVAVTLVLASCVGTVADEDDASLQRSTLEVCGGACGERTYNACTCAMDDPCGWSKDEMCDRRCADFVEEVEIFTDEDCPQCAVTMCLTGAISHTSGSNQHFRKICEDPRIPGLIPDCRGSTCNSTWGNFVQSPKHDLLPHLIDVLDTNSDGEVTSGDLACEINLVGFSWGGVNAVRLAEEIKESKKISGSRVFVDRLVVMDPYQPQARGPLKPPVNVRWARSYRHSVAPARGCSNSAPLGPYQGLPITCRSWQRCAEYDYSLDPGRWYQAPAGWYEAKDVDHCLVPAVSHEAVIADLTATKSKSPRPPRVGPN